MATNNKSITKVYGIIDVVQLTEDERTLLRSVTIGHGNFKAAYTKMGMSRQTLYNALDGVAIHPDNLNAIRTYLQAKKQVA